MIRFQIFTPLALVLLGATSSPAATIFNITGTTGNPLADAAYNSAANLWSSILKDNVTVNIQRGSSSLGSGILASAMNASSNYTYTQVRNALVNDATSAADATAVANLPAGASADMLINWTTDNPNGAGSPTPYVDSDGGANNTTVRVSNANARALGLLAPSAAIDGTIRFNSTSGFTWDFDPTDGITSGSFDFVGIMAHEIGHILGFISGVDMLDSNPAAFADNAFTYRSVLDLYRYSTISQASGVADWTADSRQKYFSIDGGTTSITTYSAGYNLGDGFQASHWKDDLGIGILDPTIYQTELLHISGHDILAMDVIGWNMTAATTSNPEPGSIALGMIGFAAMLALKRKRSRSA